MKKEIISSQDQYNRWTVLNYGHIATKQNIYLNCKCSCGIIRLVRKTALIHGRSKSCGCLTREINSYVNKTHGLSKTMLYKAWNSMIGRCTRKTDPAYYRYGGIGISICDRWLDFQCFYDDNVSLFSHGLTIDRIDNYKGYSPDNCRWVTKSEQTENKKNTIFLTLNGVKKRIPEWSKIIGLPYELIRKRLKWGWSDEKILTTPPRETKLTGPYNFRNPQVETSLNPFIDHIECNIA